MSVFYKIDSTHFSFKEYWWGTPSPLVILGWLTKVLRIQIPGSMDDPAVETLQPHEVSFETFPEEIRMRFQPLIDELAASGFHSPVFHLIDDHLQSTRIYWATFCDSAGLTLARIHHRVWSVPHPPKMYLFPVFISSFTDGTFLVSSAGKADSAAPQTVRTERKLKASATDLWALHQQALALELQSKTAYSTVTRDDVLAVAEYYHAALRDFHLARKAIRPMTPAELKEMEAKQEVARACADSGLAHAEVLSEMYKLQQRKAGWGNAILLLAISLLVFFGAGAAQRSWKVAAALIPILLFHELGHFIAMRAFKYRNMRMFFIPFFGAAVSGQNYNVAGWKKAVVSLMGPVPGIIMGSLLGCAGLVLHQPLLIKAASLTLILNGFNLLPVLPLDGGWALHAALFSRHFALDAAFRALAAGTLLVGGFLAHDRILMILGFFMLVSTPISFKIARIAGDLRRRGFSAASPDDQTIPPATAQTIISELKTAFPKGMNNKSLAQHALNLFETLNARPPGWLATSALMFVHGSAFLLAVGFGIAFVIAQQADLGGFAQMAAHLPRQKLDCGSITAQKAINTQQTDAHNTIVATFSRPDEAQAAFGALRRDLPDSATLTLFGSSVLLELPGGDDSARKTWVARVQAHTTNLLVDSTNFHAGFRLGCMAPDEATAKAIVEEAEDYFVNGGAMHLIAPWTRSDTRSIAEREQHRIARRTYAKLQQNNGVSYDNPAIKELHKGILQAQRQGDSAEVQKLRDQAKQLQQRLKNDYMDGLRKDPSLDRSVIDLYNALPEITYTNSDYEIGLVKLGSRLGQLPLASTKPAHVDDRFSARWGSVSRQGLLLNFGYLSFQRLSEGAPALVEWLCSKGGLDLRYSFSAGSGFESLVGEQ